MFKVAALVWVMLGTTIAGIAVLAVLVMPSLEAQSMALIPAAGVGGYLIALPLSYLVAKRIASATGVAG